MPIVRTLQKHPSRSVFRGRWRLIVRSALAVSIASAAVALLPFRRALRFGCVTLGRRSNLDVDECVWAVNGVSRRLPWRTMCIEKGLAVQRLLRRHGVDAILHYGVRSDPQSGGLEAHVWVVVDGRAVIGGAEAEQFTQVAVFPGP